MIPIKETDMDTKELNKIIGKYPKNPLGEPPNGLTFTEMISDINALAAAVECREKIIDNLYAVHANIYRELAEAQAEVERLKIRCADLALNTILGGEEV